MGVPIGSATFLAKFVDEVCTKLTHMAERIGLMKSNIAKFLLLRACFGALPFQNARSVMQRERP